MLWGTYLVLREDQGISNNDVLSSCGREDDDLGDIIRRQGIHTAVAMNVSSVLCPDVVSCGITYA